MTRNRNLRPTRLGHWIFVALACSLGSVPGAGHAQPASSAPGSAVPAASPATTGPTAVLTLRDAAQQAVLSNPEVLARWHAIRAAEGERDAARGGLLPRVDLSVGAGPEDRTGLGNYNRRSASISLTQLLYDGFATYNEFQRLDHATRVRLFEFFEVSESVALEAARAYFDVVRYRDLVRLAEDNFVEHRAVFAQTEKRVNARVARGVDLEQVTGRLALAEANLLTETANLHDTTARFQRIVGRLPTAQMPLPPHLARDLPTDTTSALVQAQVRNPTLLAAIESVRASQSALDTRGGGYRPRVDLRLRRENGTNHLGSIGNNGISSAEVVLNWNLFNGFSDRARERQFAEQLNVARDIRDKTCRDIRQTLVIAYNDIGKLREQLEYLVAHEQAVGKALVAYRQQFDIGQRTLLDLLDTENELFQARRAVVNARQDLNLAYARTQAGLGTLLRALDLASLQTGGEADLAQWSSGGDAARACPPEPVTVYNVDKEALMQRAIQSANRMGTLNLRERTLQDAAVASVTPPEPSAATAATAEPGTAASRTPPAAGQKEQAVAEALETWRTAWAKRDLDGYLGSYAPGFVPAAGASRESWERRRRAVIGQSTDVQIEIRDVVTTFEGDDRASTTFQQQYRSATFQDRVTKTLQWQRVGQRWKIVGETTSTAK
jgi:adhesin transport system outer membrane protein